MESKIYRLYEPHQCKNKDADELCSNCIAVHGKGFVNCHAPCFFGYDMDKALNPTNFIIMRIWCGSLRMVVDLSTCSCRRIYSWKQISHESSFVYCWCKQVLIQCSVQGLYFDEKFQSSHLHHSNMSVPCIPH